MRRLLAAAAIAAAVAAALLASGAGGGDEKPTYKIVFDNAFGLVEGGDFRVGGVTAGSTNKFTVLKRPGQAVKAVVTAEVTKPGFDDFREDATCDIKPQSLIGEYFVDCQAGSSDRKLPRRTVPVEQTTSTIPIDLVNNIMRRPVRERFRAIVTELGTGLAGRPQDLQEVLKRAHPGLRETSRVLRILGDQNKILENFIADADTVVKELEANKRDVVRFIKEAGETAEISATRREDLRRTFRLLPTFLSELRPTMVVLGQLADEQIPLLADLERAAPHLDTFLARLGPFSQAARPSVRTLGDASDAGVRAVRAGRTEVRELRRLARDAPGTFKPLRQFVQTIDNRRRATENDSRAVVSAPQAPDPTSFARANLQPGDPRGFTGIESFWNYWYWQSLSLNGFDEVGHLLRTSATINQCSFLQVNREDLENVPESCRQFLGPNQPGVFGPDLSPTSRAGRRLLRESGKPAAYVGERRGENEPDAGPLPGQPDISKPQIVLPPAVQELLDHLRGTTGRPNDTLRRGVPNRLPRDGDGATQLLDYLLSP